MINRKKPVLKPNKKLWKTKNKKFWYKKNSDATIGRYFRMRNVLEVLN